MKDKNNNFFRVKPSSSLNERILEKAKIELENNRSKFKQKRWLVFFVPIFSTLAASIIAFKVLTPHFNIHNVPEVFNSDSPIGSKDYFTFEDLKDDELIFSVLNEDEDIFEMAIELNFLQELDVIELINDDDINGKI